MATTMVDTLPAQAARAAIPAALWDWAVKRGFLYVLLQAPILSILSGTVFHFVTPQVAIFPILIAVVILPILVSYRARVSDDPDEPARHLHRYALYALVPVVIFSVVRIPAFYLYHIVYWHPWYTFGSNLTNEPPGHFSSLIPGATLYALQGYSLGMGFYALFKRHTLLNALLYFGGFIGTLYSYVFPEYLLVGSQPGPPWHILNWVTHCCMGVAAWYMPRFWNGTWPRLTADPRRAALGVLALLVITPFAFAFGGAAVWQFDRQRVIDQATFNRPNLLALGDGPIQTANGPEARYQFSLRFGPRPYKNYAGVTRALDAGPIAVTGRLLAQGRVIAWCSAQVDHVATPNTVQVPGDFFPLLQRMEYADIPVTCVGPGVAVESGSPITIRWAAEATLIGDRERTVRGFSGEQSAPLTAATSR